MDTAPPRKFQRLLSSHCSLLCCLGVLVCTLYGLTCHNSDSASPLDSASNLGPSWRCKCLSQTDFYSWGDIYVPILTQLLPVTKTEQIPPPPLPLRTPPSYLPGLPSAMTDFLPYGVLLLPIPNTDLRYFHTCSLLMLSLCPCPKPVSL